MTRAAVAARLTAAGCIAARREAALLMAAFPDPEVLADRVERRAAGEPLEHVLGWAAFAGRRVAVDPGVFVPRPRTEPLARRALALLAAAPPPRIAVDLCTGSGALACVLAAGVPEAVVVAVDADPAAVACARRNAAPLGVEVLAGDLDGPLPDALRGRVDVLTAIVPYVPTGELPYLPTEARLHEPRAALDGGRDGLDVLRRVAAAAPALLRPGGRVLAEVADVQVATAAHVLGAAGLAEVRVGVDEEGEPAWIEAAAAQPVGPGPPTGGR